MTATRLVACVVLMWSALDLWAEENRGTALRNVPSAMRWATETGAVDWAGSASQSGSVLGSPVAGSIFGLAPMRSAAGPAFAGDADVFTLALGVGTPVDSESLTLTAAANGTSESRAVESPPPLASETITSYQAAEFSPFTTQPIALDADEVESSATQPIVSQTLLESSEPVEWTRVEAGR